MGSFNNYTQLSGKAHACHIYKAGLMSMSLWHFQSAERGQFTWAVFLHLALAWIDFQGFLGHKQENVSGFQRFFSCLYLWFSSCIHISGPITFPLAWISRQPTCVMAAVTTATTNTLFPRLCFFILELKWTEFRNQKLSLLLKGVKSQQRGKVTKEKWRKDEIAQHLKKYNKN